MTLKDHSKTGREKPPPSLDTGIRCWGACITSAVLLLINIGTINGFGVIMQDVQDHYNATFSQVAFVGSVLGAAKHLPSPLVGIVVDKIGYKCTGWIGSTMVIISMKICYSVANFTVFCICYGLVMGLGFSFLFQPAKTCVAFFFKDKCALATGIAFTGGGLGYLVMPKIHLNLINSFGISGLFIGNASILAALIPIITFFHPGPKEVEVRREFLSSDKRIEDGKNGSYLTVLKRPALWLFCAALLFTGLGNRFASRLKAGFSLNLISFQVEATL